MARKIDRNRRALLGVAGTALLGGIAGCTSDGGNGGSESGGDVKDSDGDGMIDSEDYAPRDASVQEKSDLEGGGSESGDSGTNGENTGATATSQASIDYPSHTGTHTITARDNFWAWEFSLPKEFVLEYRVGNLLDENYDFDVLLYGPADFEEYRAIATERKEGIRPQYLDGSAPGVRTAAGNAVRFPAGTYYLVVDNTDLSDAGDWGTEETRRVSVEAITRAP